MNFFEVVEKRKSIRSFAERPVERELLEKIVDAANTAPSSKNTRSSAFMIIEDPDTLAALSEMRNFGSAFLKKAPSAIVVLGDESKTDLWAVNSAISATFIQLAATALDLGSCWVQVEGRKRISVKPGASQEEIEAAEKSGSAEEYVKDILGIKDNMRILCVIAIGYPKEEE